MATVRVEGDFAAVLIAFSTLFLLTSQELQIRCLANAARHLRPDGALILEAFVPDLPRLVVFLPSFWLLVPGSLGVLGATELALDPGGATATVVGVLAVVSALALGLLVGTAIAQSARGALRRARRHRGQRGQLPLDHREPER